MVSKSGTQVNQLRPHSRKITTKDRENCWPSLTTTEEANVTDGTAGLAASTWGLTQVQNNGVCAIQINCPGQTPDKHIKVNLTRAQSQLRPTDDESARRPYMLDHQHPAINSTPY